MSVLAMRAAIDNGGIVRYQTLNGCEVWGDWRCVRFDREILKEYCNMIRGSIVSCFDGRHTLEGLEHVFTASNSSVTGTTYVGVCRGDVTGLMECVDCLLKDMVRAVEDKFDSGLRDVKPIAAFGTASGDDSVVRMRYVPETDTHVLVSDEEWSGLMSSFNST
jgi:hypothetical protein